MPRYTLYPTTFDVLGDQVNPTVCCVVATPAPLAVNLAEELVELLAMVNVVEVEPLAPGLKFTPTEILCPAARVLGRVRFVRVNSGFVVDAAEIVTADEPALKVAVCAEVDPTVTLPKLKLAGETVRVFPVLVVLVAVPDNATETVGAFEANTLKVPVKLPVVLGTNFSWIRTL